MWEHHCWLFARNSYHRIDPTALGTKKCHEPSLSSEVLTLVFHITTKWKVHHLFSGGGEEGESDGVVNLVLP